MYIANHANVSLIIICCVPNKEEEKDDPKDAPQDVHLAGWRKRHDNVWRCTEVYVAGQPADEIAAGRAGAAPLRCYTGIRGARKRVALIRVAQRVTAPWINK